MVRPILAAIVIAGALCVYVHEAHAWAGGPRHGGIEDGGTSGSYGSYGPKGSVPEPSTLYALGSGVALLGGASWYIRRRK
jgi:hypothetical protein